MKSVQFAWVLGAVSALGLGMAAEACSSSTTGNSSSSSSTGSSGTGSSSTHATSGGSAGGSTSGATNGSTGASGGGTSSGSIKCYAAPGKLYPEDGGHMYCPFSGVDGGKDIYCSAGQQCCSPPEGMGASTCLPDTESCPVKNSVDWVCEGTPDCNGNPGTICCGQGTIAIQTPQPGCGPDGGTLGEYPYVSGFYGSACQASCATFGDGGKGFQLCSQTSECPAGETCVPIKPKGNSVGYCAAGGTGSGTGSSSATTASSSSAAASSSAASSSAASSSH